MKKPILSLSLALLVLATAGAASAQAAATVSLAGVSDVVTYQAAPSTENRPTIDCQFFYDGTTVDTCVIHDFEGVTAGSAGCVQDSSTQVTCTGHFGTAHPVSVTLGDLDDVCIVNFANSVGGAQ